MKNAFKNVIESLQGRNHIEDPSANWRIILQFVLKKKVGRDTSVSIAIRYGLDSPEIESRWGRNFPHPSSLLYIKCRIFPGGKAAEA
jgi:hypothetical protein